MKKNERNISRPGVAVLCALFIAAALPLAAQTAPPPGNDAKSILMKMSNYVGAQQTIEFTFDSDIEVITPQLEKIQFTSSGEATVQRPDKIHARRTGGYADVELFFDGKQASVFGRSIDGYAQIDLPGSLDHLIDALRAGYGVALPAADLLETNSYDLLVKDVKEAKYMGRGVIDGVECEHLAFRNHDTDWQLWIQAGDKAIPRKMVITSKTVNGAPQYTVRVKSWKTDGKLAANTFTFTPPAGAKKLPPDGLIDLDELPQSGD